MTPLVRCEGCPHFGKLVGSRGPLDSPFVVVGESPGAKEIRDELPFVGPSGQILESGLIQNPDCPEPYITNASICFPGYTKSKQQDKVFQATQCCHSRLIQELSARPRKVILALGNPALWSLTGNYNLKITQVRGKVFEAQLFNQKVPVVASVHPSFLMHGGGSYRQFKSDVDYAQNLCMGRNDYRKYTIPSFKVLSSEHEIELLRKEFQELPPNTPVASDTETGGYDGFDHLRDHILCAGFCHRPDLVHVLPESLVPLSHRLFLPSLRYVWHNGKFDAKFFRACGVRNVPIDEDTMMLSYALEENGGVHDLEQVTSDYLGAPDWKFMIKEYLDAAKRALPKGSTQIITYDVIPKDVLHDYCSRDISMTLQVFPILRRLVASDPKLEQLYTQTLIPACRYFMRIEENGLRLDPEQVRKNSERLLAEIAKYEAEINAEATKYNHPPVNPNSPLQLVTLLYDVMKIPTRARDTGIKTLESLPQVPIVKSLMRYRKVAKAESTYVRPAPGWIGADGRVHTSYKIHGTTTGRPASADPNILNIPRDPLLRGQFVADDNHIFLEVDENQGELRVLAELSDDKELTRIYTTSGLSLHDEVTVYLYGPIPQYTQERLAHFVEKFNVQNFPEKLYDEQKMRAKNVNFGIVYGITPFGLADQIDDTPTEAQKLLDAWFKKFDGAALFIRKCREAPIKNQTLVTPFGRKRRFGVISQERIIDIQNQAANFPEQSIAADITLHVGLQMEPIADTLNVKIVNTVYDSVLFECPDNPELVQDLARQTIECFANTAIKWGFRRIPMKAEAKVGKRWGNLVGIDKYYASQKQAA